MFLPLTGIPNTSLILSESKLHAPTGQNIGHYLSDQGFFIDMSGRYLGEIVHGNRLMFNRANPYISRNFGAYGNYGNPGNQGSIGTIGGYL